jgi:hypothetical protein
MMQHFILVFCACIFILWHRLTRELRRRWAFKTLNTFVEALEAFKAAVSCQFVSWLQNNMDVWAAYIAVRKKVKTNLGREKVGAWHCHAPTQKSRGSHPKSLCKCFDFWMS